MRVAGLKWGGGASWREQVAWVDGALAGVHADQHAGAAEQAPGRVD